MSQTEPIQRLRLPRQVHALGFSAWKRPIVARFLDESTVRFVDSADDVPDGATLVVWAAGPHDAPTAEAARQRRLRIVRLEDGFLRSIGLGAALAQPYSWVVDGRGIHFDSRQPSDLEAILAGSRFGDDALRQARALRQAIVDAGLTKYNVGRSGWQPPAHWAAARDRAGVLLVVGQVEGDASIRCGSPAVKTNLQLLRAVRALCPRAYLAYKPHPDVVAGLRTPGSDEDQARHVCDAIVADASINDVLAHVDGVHVMTSLAGFEALLRGQPVTTHGQPFYAGWGLTHDRCPLDRRTRRLALDELVAGVLLAYPRYSSPVTGRPISAAEAVRQLQAQQQRAPRSGLAALGPRLREAAVRQALRWRSASAA